MLIFFIIINIIIIIPRKQDMVFHATHLLGR